MTEAQLIALIEVFRKEAEDLTQANVRSIYKSKYGEANIIEGDTVIALVSTVPEEVYDNATDYEIRFHSAISDDDINIKEAVSITDKTAVSFTVNSPMAGVLKWETFLKIPNFNYWT